MTRQKIIYLQAQLKHPDIIVSKLARELKKTTATMYNYVTSKGKLTKRGQKIVLLKK